MGAARNSEHAEESAEVEVLLAQAKKHEELGKKIKASLVRVEDNANRLEKLVSPVRNQLNDAKDLQTMVSNVSKVLDSIDRAQRPMEGKADEEKVIRQGPRSVGLDAYLTSLRRVQQQFSQLSQTPMRMNQDSARELGQLLEYGSKQIQEVFDTMLREDNKPVEPLNFITKGKPFPIIPPNKVGQMKDIHSLISAQQSRAVSSIPTIQNYAEVRGRYISTSLQTIAEGTVKSAKAMKPDEMYRAGSNPIAEYAQAIEQILTAEWSSISEIFGRNECSVAFEQTTQLALSEFEDALVQINNLISTNITTQCFLGYEILGIATQLSTRVDQQTGQLRQQLIDAAKPVRNTAMNSLSDLLDDIKRRISGMMNLPQDGAAIGYTKEVLRRVEKFNDYRDTLGSLMTSLGDGGWSKSRSKPRGTFDVSPDKDMLLSHYVSDTLEALFSTLEDKARTFYRSKPLLGIFVANNVAVADRQLRTADVRLNLGSPSKIDTWAKRGTAAYLESWREPCSALMDVQYTNRGPRPQSGTAVDSASIVKGLSSKDKDMIKEKFKTFNITFDSLIAKHKEMSRNMERDVKLQVTKEISALIEPLYGRFYDRYHEIDKGKGKYVKYDKTQLALQITALS